MMKRAIGLSCFGDGLLQAIGGRAADSIHSKQEQGITFTARMIGCTRDDRKKHTVVVVEKIEPASGSHWTPTRRHLECI